MNLTVSREPRPNATAWPRRQRLLYRWSAQPITI